MSDQDPAERLVAVTVTLCVVAALLLLALVATGAC